MEITELTGKMFLLDNLLVSLIPMRFTFSLFPLLCALALGSPLWAFDLPRWCNTQIENLAEVLPTPFALGDALAGKALPTVGKRRVTVVRQENSRRATALNGSREIEDPDFSNINVANLAIGKSFRDKKNREWVFMGYTDSYEIVVKPPKADELTLGRVLKTKPISVKGDHYTITIRPESGTGVTYDIPLFVPAGWLGLRDRNSPKVIAELISQLPNDHVNLVDKIDIYPRSLNFDDPLHAAENNRSEFKSAGMAEKDENNNRIISFFPGGFTKEQRLSVLRHELGHLVADKYYNDFTPDEEWAKAIESDKKYVSQYAMTQLREDFAETYRAYLEFDGGVLNSEFRRKYPARCKILDRILGKDPEKVIKLKEKYRRASALVLVGGTLVIRPLAEFTRASVLRLRPCHEDSDCTPERCTIEPGKTEGYCI